LFDRPAYVSGAIVRMKPVITGGGVDSGVSNLSAGTRYKVHFTNSVGAITMMSSPSACTLEVVGSDHEYDCSVESNYEPFIFRVKQQMSLTVSDYINYVSATDQSHLESLLNSKVIAVSPVQVRGTSADVVFRTASKSKTTILNLSYGDSLTLAEVTCPVTASNARLTIHNVNTNVTCPYVSNDNRGGVFYVSLQTRNLVQENFECGFPFEIDRSGLYEFETVCNGVSACSGACYNPLPTSTRSLVTVLDWQQYLFIGKTFLSHYNDNSIPDCVCDASHTLKPISLLSNNQGLAVQSWGDFP
jgi:hypothetical protein